MQKQLKAIGNSYGILVEKPILELLGITPETVLDMTTDGEALILRPIRQQRDAKVQQITREIMDQYDETFRKLAR